MRIVQVTPGLIEIPPKVWGAIEKMIHQYKLAYELLGHTCDIKYLNEVNKDDYDMVHIHMANLALEAYERGIPYYFTMHDHHTVYFGKDSFCYKQNKEAIEKSIKSFVPAKYLISYFGCKNLYYIPHGVNPKVYAPDIRNKPHKLLCVGNNGMIDNALHDRKGFIYAIEAARILNLPITVVGPINNQTFFDYNKDFKPYDQLTFIYDPNEEELVKIYHDHTIFIHPSDLEAGQPNLTLMEALSCGLPLVSTYEDDPLPGMIKTSRDAEVIANDIKKIINNYKFLRYQGINYCSKNTWETSVKQILLYEDALVIYGLSKENNNVSMKDQLLDIYTNTKLTPTTPKKPKNTISINFIDGPKVEILGPESKKYKVSFIDNGNVVYTDTISNGTWTKANKKHFVDWNIKIESDDLNMTYQYDAKGQKVYIVLDSSSLGDNIAWIPYVEEFRKVHNCEMICSTFFNNLFKDLYPEIKFVKPGSVINDLYSMYLIGCFTDFDRTPKDFRECNLQEICSSILGLPYKEINPNLKIENSKRPMEGKYVCISTASTAGCKHWQNKGGWQKVVNYLNELGYKVVVIQKESLDYMDLQGLENVIHPTTKTIEEAMNWIVNCEFFIGIGSGISWVAWALGKKVIMISGFSEKFAEFYTPHRIIDKNVCNGCWNNKQYRFDPGDWNWCPVNKNTDLQFECTKSITADMVINEINKIILIN